MNSVALLHSRSATGILLLVHAAFAVCRSSKTRTSAEDSEELLDNVVCSTDYSITVNSVNSFAKIDEQSSDKVIFIKRYLPRRAWVVDLLSSELNICI